MNIYCIWMTPNRFSPLAGFMVIKGTEITLASRQHYLDDQMALGFRRNKIAFQIFHSAKVLVWNPQVSVGNWRSICIYLYLSVD